MKSSRPVQMHHVQAASTIRSVKKQFEEWKKEVAAFKADISALADAALLEEPFNHRETFLKIKERCK